MQIKCFESAVGELFVTCFVLSSCAFVTLLVDEKMRHTLLDHCDQVRPSPSPPPRLSLTSL